MHEISDEFEPLNTELAALERLKISHGLIMGKWCLRASSFIFDRIIIKVAGYQNRHKSSVEFDFGPNQTTHFELLALEWQTFYTFELEYFWSQLAYLDQILCVASLGWGERLQKVFGQIGSKVWFPWQQKAPIGL